MFTQVKNISRSPAAEVGVAVVTVEDLRWKRRDIKSVALLAQVLAKQAAAEAGVAEAWMVEDGHVTEGSFVDGLHHHQGRAHRHAPAVECGLARHHAAIGAAARRGERPQGSRSGSFTVAEAHEAAEAFLTSASSFVMPIVAIDGRAVGNGKPGALTRRLRQLYLTLAGAPAKAA